MLNSNLSRIQLPTIRKGIHPELRKAVEIPRQSLKLRHMDVKNQSIDNIKRVVEQAKHVNSSVAEGQNSDAETKSDPNKPWKIMIGVGLGIAVVTAVGYYALKE